MYKFSGIHFEPLIKNIEGDLMKKRYFILLTLLFLIYLTVNLPEHTFAMHIMEGYLPFGWAVFWWMLFLPFFIWGIRSIQKLTKDHPNLKLLLGVAGAFVFVMSALKIPSVTGSSSHPTGVGLGAIMFGPQVMFVLGPLVLLFQALLMAHGGLTTLGANAMSMAVIGPVVGYLIYKGLNKTLQRKSIAIFAGAAAANLSTYIFTSLQLALAFPGEGLLISFTKFAGIFALTQIPLAIVEGFLTVLIWNWLQKYNQQELQQLYILKKEA